MRVCQFRHFGTGKVLGRDRPDWQLVQCSQMQPVVSNLGLFPGRVSEPAGAYHWQRETFVGKYWSTGRESNPRMQVLQT